MVERNGIWSSILLWLGFLHANGRTCRSHVGTWLRIMKDILCILVSYLTRTTSVNNTQSVVALVLIDLFTLRFIQMGPISCSWPNHIYLTKARSISAILQWLQQYHHDIPKVRYYVILATQPYVHPSLHEEYHYHLLLHYSLPYHLVEGSIWMTLLL